MTVYRCSTSSFASAESPAMELYYAFLLGALAVLVVQGLSFYVRKSSPGTVTLYMPPFRAPTELRLAPVPSHYSPLPTAYADPASGLHNHLYHPPPFHEHRGNPRNRNRLGSLRPATTTNHPRRRRKRVRESWRVVSRRFTARRRAGELGGHASSVGRWRQACL